MSSGPADDSGDERGGSVREQDRFLPIANISRIMKKALPPNAKIAKDAKETVQECVSEFISFITSEYACVHIPRSTLRPPTAPLTTGMCSVGPATSAPRRNARP